MSERTEFRTCPLCEATCGLELTMVGDTITSIRGDSQDVFSGGFICPKGVAYGELEDDPDRLTRPLIRDGGDFVPASWDDAFAAVEERFKPLLAGNRDAIGTYVGNPNVHNLAGGLYLRPLLKSLRTRNMFSASTADQMPRHVSSGLMYGGPGAIPVPDIDRTDLLLMLGANPLMSNGSLCTAPDFPGRLRALRKRGGKLVVVDPRRSRTAAKADEYLPIRPGTDALLLAAMTQVLFDEGLVDLGPAGPLIDGVESVRAVVADITPEAVAGATQIAAADIRRLARELAAADKAVVYGRIGTHTTAFGTLASWLTDVLTTLTGNLDQPGGAMWSLPAHQPRIATGRPFDTGKWTSRVRGAPEVLSEFPVATMADEMLTDGDGRIRGFLTVAGNPVLSTPNEQKLRQALVGLEAMVSVDIYLNETTQYAHVILPSPPDLTRSRYDIAFYGLAIRNVANYSPPLRELSHDERPEWQTLSTLAAIFTGAPASTPIEVTDEVVVRGTLAALRRDPNSPIRGMDDDEILSALGPEPGPDRIVDLLLRAGAYGDGFDDTSDGLNLARLKQAPHGIDFGALESRLPDVLTTETRRVQLAPEKIIADVPRLMASAATAPEGLMLVGRRHVRSNNSWMHNLQGLAKGSRTCTLQVHPDDAAERGLADGGQARVTSRVGTLDAVVEVTDDVMRGVVSLPHGWGHDEAGTNQGVAQENPGVNSNMLTDELPLDPLSGNAVLNAIPVEVSALVPLLT